MFCHIYTAYSCVQCLEKLFISFDGTKLVSIWIRNRDTCGWHWIFKHFNYPYTTKKLLLPWNVVRSPMVTTLRTWEASCWWWWNFCFHSISFCCMWFLPVEMWEFLLWEEILTISTQPYYELEGALHPEVEALINMVYIGTVAI